MEDLRYPIGQRERLDSITAAQRQTYIRQIAGLPQLLREATAGLSGSHFSTPYRPGGWTLRQVVNHLVDSHMNALIRFKLALTEDRPTVKPYDEAKWAECADTRSVEPEQAIVLLEALHLRWVVLLRSMTESDFARIFVHPESGDERLDQVLALYAWHGRHHTAHITSLRRRMGW